MNDTTGGPTPDAHPPREQQQPERYDAIIIGGGPSGSVAAARLAMAGWRVAIVEQAEFPRRKVCGEYLSATNAPVLRGLGLWDAFAAEAGPEVKRVALFQSGRRPVTAALPLPSRSLPSRGEAGVWGRALTRDRLDAMLIGHAQRQGAHVLQPWRCVELSPVTLEPGGGSGGAGDTRGWQCVAENRAARHQQRRLAAPVVIAGHGSWTRQPLPTQPAAKPPAAGDLLGFKAHFTGADLPADLMPLLSFPGGYGGMVTCQDGLSSLSCCVRMGTLDRLRGGRTKDESPGNSPGGGSAGERVFDHIRRTTPPVAAALDRAQRVGPWLAAGPLRPGRRPLYRRGLFAVGNAAGEAHPVVAEGISMAMQSGWLAAESLVAACGNGLSRGGPSGNGSIEGRLPPEAIDAAGAEYARLWTAAFAPRIRASFAIAAWAMRPALVRVSQPAIRLFPPLLTLGARLSGKARLIGQAGGGVRGALDASAGPPTQETA